MHIVIDKLTIRRYNIRSFKNEEFPIYTDFTIQHCIR